MIRIFSSKNAAVMKRALGAKTIWAEVLKLTQLSQKSFAKEKLNATDQLYLDITGLTKAELKKSIEILKKSGAFWGIIDPKGTAADPASFFFQGAGDYIGQALFKKGLDKKRFTSALSFTLDKVQVKKSVKEGEAANKKKVHVLPISKFPGWKKIRAGTTEAFFFLFVSISAKSNLRTLIGEIAFNTLKNRLRYVLQENFNDADALLWMETEDSTIFLVPPRTDNIRIAIETVFKMILNNRLIGLEKLRLNIPADFTFALHHGQTIYQAPGKTGAVISESVNYIFHLGTKKAETGRLTISDTVPEEAIPDGLKDLFRSAGSFEDLSISHTRRFVH